MTAVSTEQVIDFDDGWLFGGVFRPGAELPGHPDRQFARVTLPHTVTPLSWGDWNPGTWEHVWIYRKHLDPAVLPRGRVFLDFDGVMTNANVFLQGVMVAQHFGGYLPWSTELTRHLRPGRQVLAVVVDARWCAVPPGGASAGARSVDFLQPGGIYRDVRLRGVPDVFLSNVFVRPISVLRSDRRIVIRVTIDAAVVPQAPLELVAELLDGGRVMASAERHVSVRSKGTTDAQLTINAIGKVDLWSPDTPALYEVRVTVRGEDIQSHAVRVRTGFREAVFKSGGFYLNGERLKLFGVNRHQLYPYLGMAAPERLQRRDAELLRRELNCNMVRCSHYPQSPHFLDACDELGLMVWEETPGWQHVGSGEFRNLVVQNIREMVLRDRNRPSVIAWGTRLNESPDRPTLDAIADQTADALDGSRPTAGAVNVHSTLNWAQDVFGHNDYHAYRGRATLLPPLSGVPYLVTEAVGALDGAPFYRWTDNDRTLSLQARMHADVHDVARSNDRYAGLLGWAGIDYASLSGHTWHNVKWPGVIDTFRVLKPGAAVYRTQVSPSVRPIVIPVFFWDLGPGSSPNGPGPRAMIATNCERLEIYVGGKHHCTSVPAHDEYRHLAYPPAFANLAVHGSRLLELRIDGYVGGTKVATRRMSANRSRDRLALRIEDRSIRADGKDATRFTFRALDVYGNQRPHVGGDVRLWLNGPAKLIAQNPFAFAEYGGVGGGFVRSKRGRSGVVLVTARHATLGRASASLRVVPAT